MERCVNDIINDIFIDQRTGKVALIKINSDVCDDKIELQLNDYTIENYNGTYFLIKKRDI